MRFPLPGAGRRAPEHGVHEDGNQSTIVFLTVCSKGRQRWIAQRPVQDTLVECWRTSDAWLVGDFLLMPDHLHLFCAPRDRQYSLEEWVRWWKRRFSGRHLSCSGPWQRDFWDTRLRRPEHYERKWWYVRENPVRAGLIESADDWPFQGRLHELRW